MLRVRERYLSATTYMFLTPSLTYTYFNLPSAKYYSLSLEIHVYSDGGCGSDRFDGNVRQGIKVAESRPPDSA